MLQNAVIHRIRPYHLEYLDADVSTTLKHISEQHQVAGCLEQVYGPSGKRWNVTG
jgi:hypothetical protein